MTKRDENDLTDEEFLQMWEEGEPVKIAPPPPPAQESANDNDGSPLRSRRSPNRKV
jgi:hypothetical protein